MAELASTEIFSVFGWKDVPPRNQNWTCVEKKRHGKSKGPGTHPTDTVWTYTEPYSGKTVYVNADLKSFASSTIETTDLAKALRSLSRSVECAPKSSGWQRLYADASRNYEVIGMLFVYNHDGLYKKKFGEDLKPITPSRLDLQAKDFVGVVGPDRVTYLNSVAKEVKSLQADGKIPPKSHRYFFFPHLTRGMAAHQKHSSVPLDHLLSPLVTLGYEFSTAETLPTGVAREGVIGFYDGCGESKAEFKYLLDYFIKYQIADGKREITVSLFQPIPDAAAVFERAKAEFARDHWPVGNTSEAQFAELLGSIRYREIQSVVQRFSEVNLGMQSRG